MYIFLKITFVTKFLFQLQASFCLEDNDCDSGVEEKYKCENFGDQVKHLNNLIIPMKIILSTGKAN